ncbi:hypothetical protein C0Q70_01870 [Pomacea canaliculata]|uniref:Uncharacterized protein n=1 Tax=Pomacea canaliculata TaxID=400727 RepID=A0A2T7Q0P1_POMCA|nr:hypothetical protein C0Q70_01870 [Pomacea canaliculata]
MLKMDLKPPFIFPEILCVGVVEEDGKPTINTISTFCGHPPTSQSTGRRFQTRVAFTARHCAREAAPASTRPAATITDKHHPPCPPQQSTRVPERAGAFDYTRPAADRVSELSLWPAPAPLGCVQRLCACVQHFAHSASYRLSICATLAAAHVAGIVDLQASKYASPALHPHNKYGDEKLQDESKFFFRALMTWWRSERSLDKRGERRGETGLCPPLPVLLTALKTLCLRAVAKAPQFRAIQFLAAGGSFICRHQHPAGFCPRLRDVLQRIAESQCARVAQAHMEGPEEARPLTPPPSRQEIVSDSRL